MEISTTDEPYKHLLCALCSQLYTEPVELPCQHFFCRGCITKHWQDLGSSICPHCSTVVEGGSFRTNILLSNITVYLQQKQVMATEMHSHPLCVEHQKKLERFCITDSEVICLDCRDSRKHLHHEVLNAQEAAGEFKEQLKKSLKNLSHKRDQQNSIVENYEAQLNAVPEKTRTVEEQIKKSFGKLHAFLYEEENALLQKLHKDEEQLREILEQRIQIIKNELQLLTFGLEEVEKSIEEEDEISFLMVLVWIQIRRVASISPVPFMQSHKLKKMQERIDIPSKDVDLSPVALKDDQYAGPLQYWIWRKMFNILELTAEPVKLNHETACPFLILDGQTRVRCGDKKRSVPDLPERFDPAACVLGNTGFDTGRYYWEVDVGIKTEWGLGVAKDSVNRKGEVKLSPSNGFWAIVRDGEVYGAYTVPPTPLKLTKQPRRIGVYLDCEKGLLSFYDPYEFSCIYTYKDTFVEKVYPFFFTGVKLGKGLPLQIITPRL